MKKILAFCAAILLTVIALYSPEPTAAASMWPSAAGSVAVGSTITITVNVSDASNISSGGITVTYDNTCFDLTGGSWNVAASLKNFDTSKGKGTFAFDSASSLSGAVFSFTLKAKKITKPASSVVSVALELRDPSGNKTNLHFSHNITITCATHSWSGWTVTAQPSCTTAGSQYRTCSVCGDTDTQAIAAKGHTAGTYSTTQEPTCTANGVKAAKCTTCGATLTQSIAALGHSYGNYVQETAPTCSAKGTEVATCSRCGAKTSREIDYLPHTYNSEITVESTCTEEGVRTNTCKDCGYSYTEAIAALGHDYGPWNTITASTCTEAGTESHTCRRCSYTETQEAALASHDFGSSATVLREATIAVPGLIGGTCTVCGTKSETYTSCTYTDKATEFTISADEGVFLPGTEITVTRQRSSLNADNEEQNPTVSACKKALSDLTETITIYTWTAKVNGEAVTPAGTFTLEIPYPAVYSTSYAVYQVNKDGSYDVLACELSADKKTILVTASSVGNICVCDLHKEVKQDTEEETNPYVYLAIGGLCAVVAFFLGILVERAIANNKKNAAKKADADKTAAKAAVEEITGDSSSTMPKITYAGSAEDLASRSAPKKSISKEPTNYFDDLNK